MLNIHRARVQDLEQMLEGDDADSALQKMLPGVLIVNATLSENNA